MELHKGCMRIRVTIGCERADTILTTRGKDLNADEFLDLLGLVIQESGFLNYKLVDKLELMCKELKLSLEN